MTGLIPLALTLGTSGSPCSKRASPLLPAHDSREGAAMSPPLTLGPSSSPSSPARPKLPRLCPPRWSPRRTLPASAAEWRRALDDVKRAYLGKRHHECSARCHEMLSLASQELQTVEPVYLVHLRFYAATALEAQAGIQSSAQRRVALLRQAQIHYRAAALLAEQPSPSISSRSSSPIPSLRSSTASDLSWSPVSTRMSSPDPSFGWPQDGPRTPEPPPAKPKKRVSFGDVPHVEPFIRPDSPTLGLQDWLAPTPSRPVSPEPMLKQERPLSAGPRLAQPFEMPDDLFVDASPSPRYHSLLGALLPDMLVRLTALHVDIAACQAVPESEGGERPLDLKARAQRLRANGWRRPRFDAQRYQTLRENALADLAL